MDIELEIQARVEFKMKELLKAVENTAKTNWNVAFQSGHPKYEYYWEAFKQMKSMFTKEMQMPVPYDDMVGLRKRKARDKAVDEIMESCKFRGSRENYNKERLIAYCVENAQNW